MTKKQKICGIYIWTNILNNKKYVGCSIDIIKRWDTHEKLSNAGLFRKFYNAIRKYGVANFKKEIVELCPIDKKILKNREEFYIDLYDTIKTGYNIEKQYNTITFHPDSERICKQISDKAKLRKWINNGNKNITVCPEKIDEYLNIGWHLGRLKFTEDHKKELSISHKGYKLTTKQKQAWCGGRKHSQDTKDNMSKNLQGRYSYEWYIEKYGSDKGINKYREHHNKSANTQRGKIIINNTHENKKIYKEELEQFIKLGWMKGRLWKN